MRCRDFQSRISAYVEGEQDEGVRRLMDAHLGECPGCVEALHGVRGIQARLGRLQRVRPSADFTFALRGKLLMEAAQSRSLRARAMAWLFPTVPRTVLSGALVVVATVGLALMVSDLHRPSLPGGGLRKQDAEAAAFLRAQEIPSHYVLERIPAFSRHGVAISSHVYKVRNDSLSASHNGRMANVRYVRF